MKSPEEIKKGLEYAKTNCLYVECCEDICPYNKYCDISEPDMMTEIPREIVADALAYIQQLERGIKIIAESNASAYKKRDSLEKRIIRLQAKCLQLERERDAAVADIPRACGYCKWFEINRGGNMTECHNPNGCRNISGTNTGWEWRVVKED